MTTDNTASAYDRLQTHVHATGNMIDDALDSLRAKDKNNWAHVMAAFRAGAMAKCTTAISITTGLTIVSIEIVLPDGKTHQLARVELEGITEDKPQQ